MSIGEVVDRWTISYLKHFRAQIDTHLECWACQEHCQNYDQETIKYYFNRLLKINGDIWNLESDIRQGKEGELGFEEVGRRALQIRDFNGIRISLKNELNLQCNEGFQEIKINHASS